jgi:signal transduction histidine kinase
LDKLAWQVAQRDENDLRSIDRAELPRELQPLADSINRAFERLKKALAREKQFTSDAAHELRTPVTIIQTQLENALAEAPPGNRPTIESALAATRSLGQLISQLLELARWSPQSQRAAYQTIDLTSLVRQQIAASVTAIDEKQLQVSLQGEEGARVEGNPRLLAIMVRNLLDNAIKYTPKGGRIDAVIHCAKGATQWVLSDSGAGIPAELRQRALRRFYRLPAQQADAGVSGCGLGLALVDMIAELHGADLSLADAAAGGLEVTLKFPRAG